MATPWNRLLTAAVLIGLGAAVWKAGSLYRARRVPRVLLLSPAVEGIDPAHALGLGRLVMDQMEIASGATVLAPPEPPSDLLLQSLPPGDLVVRLSGRREGDALSLRVGWLDPAGLREGRPWHSFETASGPPAQVLRQVERGGPLPLSRQGAERLAPQDPARFWALVAAVSVQDDEAALKDLDLSRALTDAEPGSAAAWTNLGEHLYRSLWAQPAGGDLPQAQALAAFDRALALIPGYPRAALLKGMLLTDVGDQREALQTLVDARRLRPGVPDLYAGLAYAGRTSGLLEGAFAAVRARERLVEPLKLPTPWFAENTYLYSGRWEAFRSSLQGRHDPVFLFYNGYLDLIQGRKEESLGFFQEGARMKQASKPFSDLCGIYALAVAGRPQEALASLSTFEEERGRLRIPDGELTFKVAEAYALLGRPESAIEAAGRAFAQGFGCLAWYEKSPLFARARQSPRWTALRQHLEERQALLTHAFPPGLFG